MVKHNTEEDNINAHTTGRDIWTPEKRGQLWRQLEAYHERNRDKHSRRPFRNSITLWSGDVGDGKTLNACCGDLAYYRDGMPVSSNASYKFGDTLEGPEIYHIDDMTEPNSASFTDETHIIANTYAAVSVKNRRFTGEITLFRKNGKRVNLASAEEESIDNAVKRHIDWVCYPTRHVPATVKRGGNYDYPWWTYFKIVRIGPRPWRGRRKSDEVPQAGIVRPPIRVYIDFPHPYDIFIAAGMMNSYEKPDIGAAMFLDAKAMREYDETGRLPASMQQSGEDAEERDLTADVFNAMARALSDGYPLRRSNSYKYLAEMVRQYAPGVPITDDEVLSVLEVAPDLELTQRNSVSKGSLMKTFKPRIVTGAP